MTFANTPFAQTRLKYEGVRMQVDLCPISEIPAKGTKIVDFFGRQVHVLRGEGGTPTAFMDVCLHLGGPLVFSEGHFECEWHGAAYDGLSGMRMSDPAPEGATLLRLPTKVEGGVLKYVYGDEL